MKVLHVIDTLHVGGAEKVFVMLTSILREHNVQTDGLVFNYTGGLINSIHPNVNLHKLNRTNKYSLKKLREAHVICRGYDIIHVHMRHCHAYIKLAQFIFNGKYKVILHDHTSAIDDIYPLRLRGILKPDYYIGVTEKAVSWAESVLNIDADNCHLLYNTILPDPTFQYVYPKNNQNTFLVSNIRMLKNIDFAIELSLKINKPLTIYGNKGEELYYNHIKETATKANVKVIENMNDFSNTYNNYSLAIHTSKSETGPLVLLEYLAYGIPFLAYKTGTVADMVSQELPLHFVNSFDINEWEKRIDLITAKGDISEELRNVFNTYFSPESYVHKCIEIYQNVAC